MLVDRTPCPDVAPAELAAADVDVVGLLHDAVVDRDGAALRIGDFQHVTLGVGADGAHHAAEHRVVLGKVFLESLDDRAHGPHEDSRVPVEFARLQEHLRQFEVGLLGEALDLADGAVVRDLDVAVARVGARGFDAHGHQRVVLRCEGETFGDDFPEVVFVEDQVVRRGDDHFGVGIALHQRIGRIGHAGGGVAAHGLTEHLFLADLRNVFQYQSLVFVVRHHQKILRRDDFCEAFVRVADKGFPRSQNIEELFGHRLPAFGPETRSDAARHDDTIFIACHSYYMELSSTKIKIF